MLSFNKSVIELKTVEYFQAFNAHDVTALRRMYTDDVVLDEFGKTIYEGKMAVLKANDDLFAQHPTVTIKVLETAANDYCTFNKIRVHLDPKTYVDVVDVIYFEQHGPRKIKHIQAYGGQGVVV